MSTPCDLRWSPRSRPRSTPSRTSTSRPRSRDKAGPVLADARDKATPYVAEARDRATAALAEVRDNAGPVLADARDRAVDKAAPLVADARGRASEVAAQAKEVADARVAQLRGEKPKKGSRLKKIALFAAVAAVVGFAASKLRGGSQQDDWQSSYVPTPAPGPSPATEDPAGSAPDEAVADATETAHPVSTPDEPAEVVDLDPPQDS